MKKMTSSIAGLSALALTAPAFAHYGDHGDSNTAHWLVDHGLLIGGIAAAALVITVYALRKKS